MDHLPTEVLSLILDEVGTFRDLMSLINAYAPFFRVYCSRKLQILKNVSHNAIHPYIMVDISESANAVGVATLYSQINPQGPYPLRNISDFCYEYYQKRVQQSSIFDQLPGPSDLECVSETYLAVEYFLADFASKALSSLKSLSCLTAAYRIRKSAVFSPHTISTVERTRLQRAFLRFDIYQKLFQWEHSVPAQLGIQVLRHAKAYLESFSQWEVEEIACIFGYLMSLLHEVFAQIEDDFIEQVIQAGRLGPDDFVKEVSQPTDLEGGRGRFNLKFPNEQGLNPCRKSHEPLDILPAYGLRIFTKDDKPNHINRLESLISRGLPFLRRLLMLEGKDLRDAFITYSCEFRGPSIAIPLQKPEVITDIGAMHRSITARFRGDSVLRCNAGWCWAFRQNTVPQIFSAENFRLRECGYVFWDEKRLRDSRLTQRSRNSEFNKARFPARAFQTHSAPSAEEHLYGAKVYPFSMEKLSCDELLFRMREKELFKDTVYRAG